MDIYFQFDFLHSYLTDLPITLGFVVAVVETQTNILDSLEAWGNAKTSNKLTSLDVRVDGALAGLWVDTSTSYLEKHLTSTINSKQVLKMTKMTKPNGFGEFYSQDKSWHIKTHYDMSWHVKTCHGKSRHVK